MAETITLRKPFEAHVHGRQGEILKTVAPMTARQFWGAIFEPNLQVPITTRTQARNYRQEIMHACSAYPDFKPYVLAYLTDTIDPDELAYGCADGDFLGLKFYPRGATTNSDSGVVDVRDLWKPGTRPFNAIRAIHGAGKVVQLHCELNFDLSGHELDPYRKEKYFFREVMPRLMDAHDGKFSCEHLTTRHGAAFVRDHGPSGRIGCSITPHHLLLDRRDMFRRGLWPHLFCLPVIKRERHRRALMHLALSGLPYAWAGTDSAPHDRRSKETECCSGGIFTAHAAIETYLKAFEREGLLNKHFLNRFFSASGPEFYDLRQSEEEITFAKEEWSAETLIQYSENPEDTIRPFTYKNNRNEDEPFSWKLVV